MVEPRTADESVLATLHRARVLIEDHEFESAAVLYTQVLDADLPAPLRGEVLTNLGAALCFTASGRSGAAALAQLDQAQALLTSALACRPRRQDPVAWTTTRANLAIVHLARYKASGSSDELLSAHLALDDTETTLAEAGETTLLDWVRTIRDQLVDLRERRKTRR